MRNPSVRYNKKVNKQLTQCHLIFSASNDNAVTLVVAIAACGSIGAVGGLFYTGHIRCESDYDSTNLECPLVPIMNLSLNEDTSMSVAIMTFALFGLVFLTCCHIFLIALQKLRVRKWYDLVSR